MTTVKKTISKMATLGGALLLGGCDILDVDNPNAQVEEDIRKVEAASSVAYGADALVGSGVASIYASFSTVGDEITWIGSRDAWDELDEGTPNNTGNEFVDGSFPSIAQARWMSHYAVNVLGEHVGNDPGNQALANYLASANMSAGVAYSTIAQMFDDFAFSDRTEPGPLIGEAGMGAVFDQAISYFTAAMTGSADLSLAAQAVRAQAHHQKAIWGLLNPSGSTPANPLINDASANSDASAVLAQVAGTDWKYRFVYSSATISNNLAFQVNERGELQIGQPYATFDPANPTILVSHDLMDPIEEALDTRYKKYVDEFLGAGEYAPLTVVSERGLHLILAEAALATGDMAGFTQHINMIREGLDKLTAYSDQIPAIEMLRHERRVNLFLQFKRLQDHYRFGEPSVNWTAGSVAMTTPGTMLPITRIEIQANCHHPQNALHPCAG